MLVKVAPYKEGDGAQGKRPAWVGELLRKVTRSYQRPWLTSESPFTLLLGGRQLGKDRSAGGVKVGFSVAGGRGKQWHCLSAGQRHSHDLLREVKRFAGLFIKVAHSHGYGKRKFTVDNKSELEIDGDCRVISHPATPQTAQGARAAGGVLLNEIGIMPNAKEIYGTVYPIITGQHDQGRNSELFIMGNASYVGSHWDELWHEKQKDPRWACHIAPWEECMRSWRRELGWSELQIQVWLAWRKAQIIADIGRAAYLQWFACQFRSPEDSFFDPRLMQQRTYDPGVPPPMFPDLSDRSVHQSVGWDPARKSHPSGVCQVLMVGNSDAGGRHFAHAPRRLRGGRFTTWSAQVEEVVKISKERTTLSVVGDETGPGDAPMELLEKSIGHKAHRYTFSQPSRLALARNALDSLERGVAWVPNDTDFLMEISSIYTTYGEKSGEKLVIPVDSGTHADMAVAWMLAQWGATHGPAPRPSAKDAQRKLTKLRTRR